jgi:hypothetical protein
MPCRWLGEVSCTALLVPTVWSNGHRRVGTPGSYVKPLRQSREGRELRLGVFPKSSNHLRQVIQDRGGLHGRHVVRWMKRPVDRFGHSRPGSLRIRASPAKPLRYQGHPRQPIWNALFSLRPSRSCLHSACDLGLMSAAGNLSQHPARKELSEPAHVVLWQWDACQAGLCLFEEAQHRRQRRKVAVLLWMGRIQRGHQMLRKRETSLPCE